jgi:2',3'-cyclic-nucleotide 2'-phosphodiesterase (5'-nucleotidase family)
MMFTRILILIIGAGLTACSSYTYTSYNANRVAVDGAVVSDAALDSLVSPYRRALSLEMNRVIGKSLQDMSVARPNSVLGQWTADVLLRYGRDSILKGQAEFPVIALLNTGGLRASLPKGNLTVGDVFKLMPFDNLLVALKLPAGRLPEIEQYIAQTGGEPIAGFRIVNGKIQTDNATSDYFWVITSDFLANGGDRMLFFREPEERILTGVLLRDLLMREIEQKKVIEVVLEERITF